MRLKLAGGEVPGGEGHGDLTLFEPKFAAGAGSGGFTPATRQKSADGNPTKNMDHVDGGCACGNVRYRIDLPPSKLTSAICHCRQCARQTGSYCLAVVKVDDEAFTVLNGDVALFHSSVATRGFCRECGFPLLFRYNDAAHLSVCVASLDGGDECLTAPTAQYGCESMSAHFSQLHELPAHSSKEALAGRNELDDDGNDGRRPASAANLPYASYGRLWALHQLAPFADKALLLVGILGQAGPVDTRPIGVIDWAMRLPLVLLALLKPSQSSLLAAHLSNLAAFVVWLPICWDHMGCECRVSTRK